MINKSFLKWAGGKSRLLPFLKQFIQEPIKGTFIEPFIGSGVVFANVEAENYIINDINKDLINVYEVLKEHKTNFVSYCKNFFETSLATEESFYSIREAFNHKDLKNTQLNACMFLWLNRYCFNGLCRYNKSGGFNVPYGKYKTIYFPEKELNLFVDKLQNVTILNVSFEDVFNLAKNEDVVYCDPPYLPLNTASFKDYAPEGFSFEQQSFLAEKANSTECLVLISNHNTEEARKLYCTADELVNVSVSRFVSAKSSSRKPVEELLAIYKKRN